MVALSVVARADAYGWQVLHDLRAAGLDTVGDASVYGTLQRLCEQGLLSSYMVASELGPSRKYYAMTASGRAALAVSRQSWCDFQIAVAALVDTEREVRA
jgi:PadR family transcriptional regulator PadR